MSRASHSFRVGQVQGYLRGRIWYLCYYEHGQRHRPRVGPDRDAARQLAAQTNAQLEISAPAVLSFEPITIPELRDRWLDHHEHVLRSSVASIKRYRTGTDHLLRFLSDVRPVRQASQLHAQHAEEFVRYLRSIRVSPNGHPHSRKRPLLDKGIKYILETCRAMFTYAAKRRHLSPYAENPFTVLQIDRIPIEEAKPIVLFTPEQERQFLEACDSWQFPVFLTLMLTGVRPGELAHFLLPEDLDLEVGLLKVRNKPKLGWQVKTRTERDIPIVPPHREVLRRYLGGRAAGPVFRLRRFSRVLVPLLSLGTARSLENELTARIARREHEGEEPLDRASRLALAREVWRDAGSIPEQRIRLEFMRITSKIGLAGATTPKLLRHQFATSLQDANVDPLIRNELMGHSPGSPKRGGLGMTTVYTHTDPVTRRRQLEAALICRPAIEAAQRWLARNQAEAQEHAELN